MRNLRVARTLSQAQLAQLAEMSQQHLSKAERGIVTLPKDKQERIAVILGTSRVELFPEDEQVPA